MARKVKVSSRASLDKTKKKVRTKTQSGRSRKSTSGDKRLEEKGDPLLEQKAFPYRKKGGHYSPQGQFVSGDRPKRTVLCAYRRLKRGIFPFKKGRGKKGRMSVNTEMGQTQSDQETEENCKRLPGLRLTGLLLP